MFDDYTRLMFGNRAVHVGANLIIQPGQTENGQDQVVCVLQSRMPANAQGGHPLAFGSQRSHILALGDLVFRPHLILASDALRGRGLTSLAKDGFTDTDAWFQGDVLLDPLARGREMRRAG
jgi:hypothetical protein